MITSKQASIKFRVALMSRAFVEKMARLSFSDLLAGTWVRDGPFQFDHWISRGSHCGHLAGQTFLWPSVTHSRFDLCILKR